MTPFKSFEEVYQSAYSHGLEQIYKLENIDIKSVRKIEPRQELSKKMPVEEVFLDELDLGDGHRLWITPSVFDEPIDVLELNRHPDKFLKEQGITNLKSLYETNLSQFIFTKGLGQGHIDEIGAKLSEYIQGKPIVRQYTIDFSSWLSTIFHCLSKKEAYLLGEQYDLNKPIALTPLELMDVRKLNREQKIQMIKEAKQKICLEKHKIIKKFKEIDSAFIRPWVLGRLGIASKEEVEERLLRKSIDKDLKRWRFLSDLIPEIAIPSMYYATPHIEADYLIMEKAAKSYFWNDTATYPIMDLYQLVAENLSLSFRTIDFAKFFKFLETSTAFTLVNENSTLLVSIS